MRNRTHCFSRAVNGKITDAVVVDVVMNQVLTVDAWEKSLRDLQRKPLDAAALDWMIAEKKVLLVEIRPKIEKLMHALEIYNGPGDSLMERLRYREAERQVIQSDLDTLEQKRAAMFLEIDLIRVGATFEKWRTTLCKTLRKNADPDSARGIVKNFTSRIEIGYHQMRLRSSYPVDLKRGVIVAPSDIDKTTFWRVTNDTPVDVDLRTSGKASLKMLERLIVKPEKPALLSSDRDREIFRLYSQEKVPTSQLAIQYRLSPNRIRAISAAVRKHQ